MTTYLILAAVDISKSNASQTENTQRNNRNITIDSEETGEGTVRSTNSYSTAFNGTIKFILKAIEPPSEELVTAFEYSGSCCCGIDPKSLIGSIIKVNNPEFCRGILLLKSDQCQITKNNATSNTNTSNNTNNTNPTQFDQDSFDEDLIEELFNDHEFI